MTPGIFLLSASSLLGLADLSQDAALASAEGTKARQFMWLAIVCRDRASPKDVRNCERQAEAYHALGDRPRALAWVRRAMRAAPIDRQLWGLRERLIDELSRDAGIPPETIGPPTPGWPSAGVVEVVLAVCGWPILLWGWRRRRAGMAGGGLALIAAACYLMLGASGDRREVERMASQKVAILLGPRVPREGNADDYPGVTPRPWAAGSEVELLGERGGWVRVRGPGGVEGWLPTAGVAR